MRRLGSGTLAVLLPVFLIASGPIGCGDGGNAGPSSTGGMAGGGRGGSGGGGGGGSAGIAGGAGTAGSGGSAGAAGATGGAGAGGSGGVGGTGGGGGATAGAGGAAGAAGSRGGSGGTGGGGTAGAAGSAGTAGSGGSGGSGTAGAGGSSSGLRLEYQNSSSGTTMFSVRITNDGPSTPLISVIKVRYYFRDDSTNRDATPMVLDAKWKIASPSATIDLRMGTGCGVVTSFATPPANSYFEVDCATPSPMLVGDTITMSLATSPLTQLASNDYSYADTAGAFAPNTRLLVILNGVVVAGTAP